jgi:CrcB protein
LRTALLISLGAVVGANARYLIAVWAVGALGAAFPYGTFIVNVTGSFLVGFIVTFLSDRAIDDPAWRLLLVTGFCGGYTTFSTYAFEAIGLLRLGQGPTALIYVVGSVVVGLVGVVAGTVAARVVA